jgi:hypothetical protein
MNLEEIGGGCQPNTGIQNILKTAPQPAETRYLRRSGGSNAVRGVYGGLLAQNWRTCPQILAITDKT